MADSKISNLDAVTSLTNDDLLVVVNDPSGTPTTNKITVADALGGKADLSGAEFTGPITLPQGSLGSESIVISGSTDFGLYNTGAGLVVSDGTNISFIAYSNEIVTYIPVRPSSDNTGTLGDALVKYNNVYSTNGTFDSVTIGNSGTIGGNAVLTTATGATTGKAIAMAMIFG